MKTFQREKKKKKLEYIFHKLKLIYIGFKIILFLLTFYQCIIYQTPCGNKKLQFNC